MLLCGSVSLRAQVVINELMPAPAAGLPEWIELLNAGSDSVDLAGWSVRDAAGGRVLVSAVGMLPPGASVVIASSIGLEGAVPGREACILVLSQLPSLNNGGDDLVLLDAAGEQVDSMFYRSGWGYEGGVSLERVSAAWEGTLRVNWRACVDATRMTPCAPNSVALPLLDVAVDPIRAVGEARMEAPVRVASVVRNVGVGTVSSVDLVVYEDRDGDGVPAPSERVIDGHWSQLAAGDSASIEWLLDASSEPRRVLFSEVRATGDERFENDARIDTLRMGVPLGTVLINEVMYAPRDGEPEWVELFNASLMDVDIGGWSIGDSESWRVLPSATIRAQDYLVLTPSGSLLDWHSTLGERMCVVSLPSLNNGGDLVRVRVPSGRVIDSVAWLPDWGGSEGRSLERINVRVAAAERSNWTGSSDARGTPGRRNGNAIRDHDLAPVWVQALAGHLLGVCVKNIGLREMPAGIVTLVADRNHDGRAGGDEEVGQHPVPALAAGDSAIVVMAPGPDGRAGRRRWIAHVSVAGDERDANDTLYAVTNVALQPGVLRVNEIMMAPVAGESEWIELVHAGGEPVALDGVALLDGATTGGTVTRTVLSTAAIVTDGALVVVAADSSVFVRYTELRGLLTAGAAVIVTGRSLSLADEGDAVVVHDAGGRTIDSVRYQAAWHHPEILDAHGRSLERLHPSLPSNVATSWSTCPLPRGGTPMERNAVWLDAALGVPSAMIEAHPNPFSPDGDGHEDFCMIGYRLPIATAVLRVRVFDTMGRLCRTLAAGQLSGSEGQILFDGCDEQRRRLDIGLYILYAEAVDAGGGVVASMKSVLVIATRL